MVEHKPHGEMKCPVCGEIFQCNYVEKWAYKKQFYNTKYVFCSWGCLRKKEKELEEKIKKRGRKKRDDSGLHEGIKTAAMSAGGGSGHGGGTC